MSFASKILCQCRMCGARGHYVGVVCEPMDEELDDGSEIGVTIMLAGQFVFSRCCNALLDVVAIPAPAYIVMESPAQHWRAFLDAYYDTWGEHYPEVRSAYDLQAIGGPDDGAFLRWDCTAQAPGLTLSNWSMEHHGHHIRAEYALHRQTPSSAPIWRFTGRYAFSPTTV